MDDALVLEKCAVGGTECEVRFDYLDFFCGDSTANLERSI